MLMMFIWLFCISCQSTYTLEQTSNITITPEKTSAIITKEPSATQINSTEAYKATEDQAASEMATLQTREHTPEVGVSNYFGEWIITDYIPKDTNATPDPTEYDPINHLGESVYLSGEKFFTSDEFLFMLKESCNNPSYRWVPASETTGAASQALLGGHPDTRPGLLYLFKIECENGVFTSFQVSASDRLVYYWAPYWFFLER